MAGIRICEKISRTRRTVIKAALESETAVARTRGFTAFPLYEDFNPLSASAPTIALNRAKPGLGPDGFVTGPITYDMKGSVYVVGSGIANVPPAWTMLLRACGWGETRYATAPYPVPTAAGVTVTPSATGGYMATGNTPSGDYRYKISKVIGTNGSSAQETKLAKLNAGDVVNCSGSDNTGSVVIDLASDTTNFPNGTPVRIYRTVEGGAGSYYYVGQFTPANGARTFTDTFEDFQLADVEPTEAYSGSAPSAAAAAATLADNGAGSVADGDYFYKISEVDSNNRESALAAIAGAVTQATGPGANTVTFTAPYDNKTYRIYRTVADGLVDSTYYYVGQFTSTSGDRVFEDTHADADLIHEAPTSSTTSGENALYSGLTNVPCVVWEALSECHDALTVWNYLDHAKYPASGCRGSIDFSADASNPMKGAFSLMGEYIKRVVEENDDTLTTFPGIPPRLIGVDFLVQVEDPDSVISGTCNTAATVVTWVSGTKYNLIQASETVTINAVDYVIDSVDSDTQLTLTTTAGSQSAVAISATRDAKYIKPVLKRVGISTGGKPNSREDANDDDGQRGYEITGEFDPRWTCEIEVRKMESNLDATLDPATGNYITNTAGFDWMDAHARNLKFKLSMILRTTPGSSGSDWPDGKTFKFTTSNEYLAQLAEAPSFSDAAGYRTWSLNWQLLDPTGSNSMLKIVAF